ncbi:MAG: hypothetical protein HY717_03195 [Planctomycetes bacterium]|nr:hypothetical protein [Planctomycetota bacterium]
MTSSRPAWGRWRSDERPAIAGKIFYFGKRPLYTNGIEALPIQQALDWLRKEFLK